MNKTETAFFLRFRSALILAAFLLLMISRLSAAGTAVTLLCSVTDKAGRFVDALGAADVTLVEEGKRQTVSSVADATGLPLAMVVLVDVSGSTTTQDQFGQKDVADFFQLFVKRGRDQVAVVSFQGSGRLVQDYTDDAAALGDAIVKIDRKQAGGGTALYDVLQIANDSLAQMKSSRKAILLMSDGEDTASRTPLNDVQNALFDNDVRLYMLSPVRPLGRSGIVRVSEGGKVAELVEQTGGFVLNSNSSKEIAGALQKIGSELHSQYVITYDSNPGKRPGTPLKLRVTTSKKGVTLRYPTTIQARP